MTEIGCLQNLNYENIMSKEKITHDDMAKKR